VNHALPQAQVIAVGAGGAPAMPESVRTGLIVNGPAVTIADGIAVRVPVPYAVAAVRQVVEEVVTVEDDDIRTAMGLLHDALGRVIEPAGAAGFAALVADPLRWRGKRVAIPLCGGNVDGP
jgi:threonine dehydratase